LVNGVNTKFDVPHSRYNQIDHAQFEEAGLPILAESKEAGGHLDVSEEQFRLVFFLLGTQSTILLVYYRNIND